MIPREKLDELKEKANIVSIISEYVPLKKRGKNYLGLCPFHSEKTPSFTVSEEKQMFHCFGCGEGGNVFAFIMKQEKLDFLEAVEMLSEKVGLPIEIEKKSGASRSYRDRILEILNLACKFYRANLEEDSGEPARSYIKSRGLKVETIKAFELGFAKDSWNDLSHHLTSKGAKTEDLEAAGLILPRKEKEGYYDRFRNRLMFPIFNLRGQPIGFSGRTLTGEDPKYLNSPDSAVFIKGDNLFGLQLAKEEIKKRKFAILVEGNIDVLSIYQAGFPNVVAPLGTALTANQAKLLSRFAETVVLAFDADTAGLTASERSQEILKEAGLKVRIADLKPHKDPDEFIRSKGAELFFENIKNSRPALEFKIKRVLGRFNLKEIEPRAQAAYQVAEILSREKDHLIQKEYVKFAAELLKLDAELLSAEVSQRNFYFKSSASHPSRRQIVKPPEKVAEAEKRLVRLALGSEGALTVIREKLGPEEFSDPDYREIISKLATLPAEKLMEEKKAREAMLEEFPEEGQEQVLSDCVNVIKGYHVKQQIEKLREDLAEAEKKQEVEKVNRLNFEYKGLSEILRGLGR